MELHYWFGLFSCCWCCVVEL